MKEAKAPPEKGSGGKPPAGGRYLRLSSGVGFWVVLLVSHTVDYLPHLTLPDPGGCVRATYIHALDSSHQAPF